ncbi:MAG: hypothetical protein RL347_1294 [Actinomycetota bacterium]|jgi:hypothetical protein
MTHDGNARVLSIALVCTALSAATAIGTVPAATAAPLLPEGSSPPSTAHLDDMGHLDDTSSLIGVARRAPAPLREPTALEIPDLGIDTTIVATPMDANGAVIVPEDVLVTGWFDGSRRLAARQGGIVIVGHRDSAIQGSGALYAIEELPIDSPIILTARDGSTYEFSVESVEFIDKANLPGEAARVFTRYGPHRLVLITCGGAFDPAAGSYLSNVVVTAVPKPGTAFPS